MAASKKCKVVIIDGQGGKIGRQLVAALCNSGKDMDLLAVGTNSIATENMLKGGAYSAATGENAVVVASRTADIIAGPLGIVIADALHGEVTPAMAVAVGQNDGKKVLIPIDRCDNVVAGAEGIPIGDLIQKAVDIIIEELNTFI
ncbi:MAG: DUF3842 family protein [Oscillospiraceae bacterium]